MENLGAKSESAVISEEEREVLSVFVCAFRKHFCLFLIYLVFVIIIDSQCNPFSHIFDHTGEATS
jgi:hypothetical protein